MPLSGISELQGSDKAAHERLAGQIWRELSERSPDAHEPLPSYRTLSRRYAASLSTVQRAMEILQQRGVLHRMERRGTFYRPPLAAESLPPAAKPVAPGRLRCVNVVWAAPCGIPAFDHAREAYLAGYTEALDQTHAAMRFVMPRRQESGEHLLSPNVPWEEQACLFVFRDFDLRLAEWLKRNNVPYVIQDSRPYFGPGLDHHHRICPNKPGGVAKAVQHLVGLGHTRIGFMGRIGRGPGNSYAGFASALIQANVAPDERWTLDLATDQPEVARPPIREYLRQPVLPTGVVARCDTMALTLLEEAKAAGMRVPHDLSIIGMNNEPSTQKSDPPLATILLPHRQLAHEAVKLLTEVAQGAYETYQLRMLDCSLIVRESTAAPGQTKAGVDGAALGSEKS